MRPDHRRRVVAGARGARPLALARDDSDRRAKSGPSQSRRGQGQVICYATRKNILSTS